VFCRNPSRRPSSLSPQYPMSRVSRRRHFSYSFEAFDKRKKIRTRSDSRSTRGENSAAPGPEEECLPALFCLHFTAGVGRAVQQWDRGRARSLLHKEIWGHEFQVAGWLVIRPNREICAKDSPVHNPPIAGPWKVFFLPSLQAGLGDRLLALYFQDSVGRAPGAEPKPEPCAIFFSAMQPKNKFGFSCAPSVSKY